MSIRNLTSRQLFTVLLYGNSGFYVPFSLILSIFSLANVVPARLNGQEYYGMQGLAIYLLFAPFVVFILTISAWIFITPGWKLARIIWAKVAE